MNYKSILSLLLVSLLFSTNAFAEVITITVKGMDCSFCAQGIKKTFLKDANVKDIKVDLDNKLVTIETRADAVISDEQLKQKINDAGYDVLSITRGSDA